MTLTPELALADRYRLVARIAVGGMGEVWRAEDLLLGRPVAVKVLRGEYAEDPTFLARFRAEARHTAMLSHPGIAGVYDYGEIGGTAYLVMELVEGEPLSDLLAREGPLPAERTLDVVGQTGLALAAAHAAGVVHRDVKPGNLMVRPDGVVKVTDFGIARAMDAAPITATGLVVGTAYYLSPEQATGRPVTPASDVYSLGVVAYECLSGRRPFVGESAMAVTRAHLYDEPPPLPADVPAPVVTLVEQAMAKDPARRPGGAGEFGRTALGLRAALTGEALSGEALTGPPATGGSGDRPAGSFAGATRVATAATALLPPVRAERRRRLTSQRAGALLLSLLAILAATLAVRMWLPGRAGDRAAGSRPSSTGPAAGPSPSAAPRVAVDPTALIGRPVAEVAARLTALGLRVRRTTAVGRTPGSVLSVTPTGQLLRGSTVTVTVAVAAPATSTRSTGTAGDGKGKGGKGKGGKGHG